jgi:hypothetical protein
MQGNPIGWNAGKRNSQNSRAKIGIWTTLADMRMALASRDVLVRIPLTMDSMIELVQITQANSKETNS